VPRRSSQLVAVGVGIGRRRRLRASWRIRYALDWEHRWWKKTVASWWFGDLVVCGDGQEASWWIETNGPVFGQLVV
jgi:hypothetical protein